MQSGLHYQIQRLQADVTYITYHGLVFSGVSRFYRVSGPAMYRRSSTSGQQQYQRHSDHHGDQSDKDQAP